LNKKTLTKLLGVVLVLVMTVGIVSGIALANQETTYRFLNPLGRVEPREDTALAERSRVTNILEATGPRTLRLGASWYVKPFDGEPPLAMAQLLKERWEAESANPDGKYPAGLTVDIIYGVPRGDIPLSGDQISIAYHPWNVKLDSVYDTWNERVDAIVLGVGD